MRLLASLMIGSLMIGLAAVGVAYAAPGDLDTSFSGDGRLVEPGVVSPSPGAIAIQADGKIVVVGESAGDFAVLRYNRNGTLDPAWGGTGVVVTDFGGTSVAAARAVAIQSDGRIVVAGRAGSANVPRVALARYLSNGTLDSTFGTNGLLTMAFASNSSGAAAAGIAIQADGRIVVAGGEGGDWVIARLLANGALDTTFGNPTFAGIVRKNLGGNETARAVAIAPDGRIVVAGSRTFLDLAVFSWDYLAGGLPQFVADFIADNGAGHASFGGQSTVQVAAMVVQPDGKVVLVGDLRQPTGQIPTPSFANNIAVARYNVDGTMDATFGTNGLRRHRPRAVLVRPGSRAPARRQDRDRRQHQRNGGADVEHQHGHGTAERQRGPPRLDVQRRWPGHRRLQREPERLRQRRRHPAVRRAHRRRRLGGRAAWRSSATTPSRATAST